MHTLYFQAIILPWLGAELPELPQVISCNFYMRPLQFSSTLLTAPVFPPSAVLLMSTVDESSVL